MLHGASQLRHLDWSITADSAPLRLGRKQSFLHLCGTNLTTVLGIHQSAYGNSGVRSIT
jgi:hypothetical protein